jgi:hypothetical protein
MPFHAMREARERGAQTRRASPGARSAWRFDAVSAARRLSAILIRPAHDAGSGASSPVIRPRRHGFPVLPVCPSCKEAIAADDPVVKQRDRTAIHVRCGKDPGQPEDDAPEGVA